MLPVDQCRDREDAVATALDDAISLELSVKEHEQAVTMPLGYADVPHLPREPLGRTARV